MKRPPKPRIVKTNLVWRWINSKGAWEPYFRMRSTAGGLQRAREIRLDWQGDPQELDRLYWQARSGRHERQQAPARHTWRECIIAWRSDQEVQTRLKPSTKKSYRLPMDEIMEKNGAKPMTSTTRKALRAAVAKLADTPRKAQRMVQTVSLLWNYAANEMDWPLGQNPAKNLGKYTPKNPYEPWPDWMVKALDTAPFRVQVAANLILGTGQRPNAAIIMRRDQFHGEWMTVVDEKSAQTLEVYCPPRLRNFIEHLPASGTYLLARNLTQPMGYDAVEKAFRDWRDSLGERAAKFSLHGLRKLAIIELAEAGCSDAEIQSVTNQSAEMVAYYRLRASRKLMSRAAQQKRE